MKIMFGLCFTHFGEADEWGLLPEDVASFNVGMLTRYTRFYFLTFWHLLCQQSTCRLAVFAALAPFPGESISWTRALASVSPDCPVPVVISCPLCEHSTGSTCTQYMGQTFHRLYPAWKGIKVCASKHANTILAFQPSPSVQRLAALLKISPGCSKVGLF